MTCVGWSLAIRSTTCRGGSLALGPPPCRDGSLSPPPSPTAQITTGAVDSAGSAPQPDPPSASASAQARGTRDRIAATVTDQVARTVERTRPERHVDTE